MVYGFSKQAIHCPLSVTSPWIDVAHYMAIHYFLQHAKCLDHLSNKPEPHRRLHPSPIAILELLDSRLAHSALVDLLERSQVG